MLRNSLQSIDIWRAAKLLLEMKGEHAAEYAVRRATDLTNRGDQKGANVWSDILAAITVLRMRGTPPGATQH